VTLVLRGLAQYAVDAGGKEYPRQRQLAYTASEYAEAMLAAFARHSAISLSIALFRHVKCWEIASLERQLCTEQVHAQNTEVPLSAANLCISREYVGGGESSHPLVSAPYL